MYYDVLIKGRGKTHVFISIGAQKMVGKIQQSFMIKTLRKLGIEGNFLSMIKGICEIPQWTSYLMWKTKSFLSNIRNKTRISTLVTSVQILLEVLKFHLEQQGKRKKMKGIQIENAETKLSLVIDNMISYFISHKKTIRANKGIQQSCRI